MNTRHFAHIRTARTTGVIALLGTLLLGACTSSRPSRFYLLSSSLKAQPGASMDVARADIHIGFYPVKITPYLDRPQIVTRRPGGEVVIDEFSRWASPLEDGILGALAGNLAIEMPDAYVDIFPWTGTDDLEYKIMVDILRMDGEPGKGAVLIAQWTILEKGADHPPLTRRTSIYEQPLPDDSCPAYVGGLGLLLEQLSKDIADCLRADIAAGKAEES